MRALTFSLGCLLIVYVIAPYDSMAVSREIRHSVTQQRLGFYKGGPERSYSEAKTRYVVSVLLLASPSVIRKGTKALLVTRKNGKKTNVSGYAGVISDPTGRYRDYDFNIVAYTAVAELHEECGLPPHAFRFRPGGRFVETNGDVTSHILTVGAFPKGPVPNPIPDGEELLACEWVSLGSIRQIPNLSSGYLRNTLPHSLMAYGLSLEQARRLVG